jgi:hypothetical protein
MMVALGSTAAYAADDDSMAPVKALVRALAYDRNLKARSGDAINVAVVFDDNSRECGKQYSFAFVDLTKYTVQDLALSVAMREAKTLDEMRTILTKGGYDTVFLCPLAGVKIEEITAITRLIKVVTIANTEAAVRRGVSLGAVSGGAGKKPRLFVNLAGSKAEGMDLSSDLLHVAVKVD